MLAQWLREFIALAEDWGLVPSTDMAAYTCLKLLFQKDPMPSSGIHRHDTHVVHIHTLRYTHIHIKLKNRSLKALSNSKAAFAVTPASHTPIYCEKLC